MKKFLVETFVFILIGIIALLFIDSVQISDEFIINKTANTGYEKIAWNLNLIKHRPDEIKESTIFFGPSLVQGGVCDSILRANGIKAINFGVNHSGNDADLFFLKRVVSLHPAKIYLHYPKWDFSELHPMTPLLYTPAELLSGGQAINYPFLTYLFNRAGFIFEYLTFKPKEISGKVFSKYGIVYEKSYCSPMKYNDLKKSLYGTSVIPSSLKTFTADINDQGFIKRIFNVKNYIKNFFFNIQSQRQFIANSIKTAAIYKIKTGIIYMPTISDEMDSSIYRKSIYNVLRKRNIECLRDVSFLDKPIYWSDLSHLSKSGSIYFTFQFLSEYYKKDNY